MKSTVKTLYDKGFLVRNGVYVDKSKKNRPLVQFRGIDDDGVYCFKTDCGAEYVGCRVIKNYKKVKGGK